MAEFPTGVAIVTTVDANGQPQGMTANAFTSLSLEPPSVIFCGSKTSDTSRAIEASGVLCLNFLAGDQGALAARFARKGPEKFEGTRYGPGETGSPVLEGSLAAVECAVERVLDGGDHRIFIARGVRIHGGDTGRAPLVFHRGAFSALG